MGKIKKILETELVGGTQSTDVYPVTSVKAVYDENNERIDNIISKMEFDVSLHNNGAVFGSKQDVVALEIGDSTEVKTNNLAKLQSVQTNDENVEY